MNLKTGIILVMAGLLFACSTDDGIFTVIGADNYTEIKGYGKGDSYTAKVLGQGDGRVAAVILTAPQDASEKNIPTAGTRVYFSESDLSGMQYEENSVISFRIKAFKDVNFMHDAFMLYYDCIVEPY